MRRAIFFVKEFCIHPVRIPFHCQRPIAKVRQKNRRDPDIVIDHLAFGEPDFRVENLVQVRNRELFTFNDEFSFFWHYSKRSTLNAQRPISNCRSPFAPWSGERRLLACSRRQLADDILFLGSARVSRVGDDVSSSRTSRKDCFGETPKVRAGLALHARRAHYPAEENRLAACAPQPDHAKKRSGVSI